MTKEEAIQILADLIDSPFLHTWEKQNKALHMAIEALSENNISKKEVINYARKCADGYSYIELPLDAFVDGINALSAEAEEAVLNKMLEEEMIVLPQDYVKVVRCKDCRFNKYPSNDLCLIKKAGIYPDDDDFCSYGERREL